MRWLGFEANIPAWSAFALLQSSTYTAPPICFLVFFQWFHTMIALRASKIAELLWTAWVIAYTLAIRDTRLFTCACATRILAPPPPPLLTWLKAGNAVHWMIFIVQITEASIMFSLFEPRLHIYGVLDLSFFDSYAVENWFHILHFFL